jgi:hypothetical protein
MTAKERVMKFNRHTVAENVTVVENQRQSQPARDTYNYRLQASKHTVTHHNIVHIYIQFYILSDLTISL